MKRTTLAAIVAFALTSPAFAAIPPPGQAPSQAPDQAQLQAGRMHRFERVEQRIDRAVQAGKLTPEQGQKFKGEAERIRAEVQSERAANGGKLTPEQRAHVKEEMQALRQQLHAAKGAAAPAGK